MSEMGGSGNPLPLIEFLVKLPFDIVLGLVHLL